MIKEIDILNPLLRSSFEALHLLKIRLQELPICH